MAILLYARVSTARQADRELSLSAQFHLMEHYAKDHDLTVAGRFQDIASARSLRDRPGLMAAVQAATGDRSIDGLLVHKLDRLSRDTFNYLVLKGRLRSVGVRVLSVVETIEASPMGEFIEHIMAAQAEFYSANLAAEVKKGLDERLRRGVWASLPPIGYRMERRRAVPDPARARFIQLAFDRWATGTLTSEQLAEELWRAGLVSTHNNRVRNTELCRILQNPFYVGTMVAGGGTYAGTHAPLVSRDLFERCQAVFRAKRGNSARARQTLSFTLSRLVACPQCGSLLVGEEHKKKSGRVHRYYRCHQKACRNSRRAGDVEDEVAAELLATALPSRLLPVLKRRIRAARRAARADSAERTRALRAARRRLDGELKTLALTYVHQNLQESEYEERRRQLRDEIRATEWLLAVGREREPGDGDLRLQQVLERLDTTLKNSTDPVERREVIATVVERVDLSSLKPTLRLTPVIRGLLEGSKSLRDGTTSA